MLHGLAAKGLLDAQALDARDRMGLGANPGTRSQIR
jgi:hypothetical protein